MDYVTDNGILPPIRGEIIAAALKALPPAALAAVDAVHIELEVSGIGGVRFTVKRKRAKRGRSSYQFWSAAKAVIVEK